MIYTLCFLFSFTISSILLHYKIGPLFIHRFLNRSSFFHNTFFIVFFYTLFTLGDIILYSNISDDLVHYINDSSVNIGENATVNVNDTKVNVDSMHKVAAAISSTGGASAGIAVARYVQGPPVVKVAAGLVAAATVQTTTVIMSKMLETNDNDESNKFVNYLIASPSGGNALDKYPLNLITDVNTLLICIIAFLYIIINISIVKYLISKDIVQYIPQNSKLSKFFVF
jgi:hypothetical protein